MLRLLRPLPLFALLAVGCDRRPDDPIFVYGLLQHLDGSPRPDVALTLERTRQPSYERPEYVGFKPYTETLSEGAGNVTLEVLHGDAVEEREFELIQYRFRLAAPLEEGHGVYTSFVFDDDVEVPPLRPWAPNLTVGRDAEGLALSFGGAPPVPPLPPSGRLLQWETGMSPDPVRIEPWVPVPVVQLHGPGGRLWEVQDAAAPWRPNPYQLEDFAGVEAQVRAVSLGTWVFRPLASNDSSVSFRVEWRGPRVPVPQGTLHPVSRGASCTPAPEGEPCPYTDGSLSKVRTTQGETDTGVDEVVLQWEAPIRPRHAVIREVELYSGGPPKLLFQVEGSLDGGSWATLGSTPFENYDDVEIREPRFSMALDHTEEDSPYGDGPLDVKRPARFVEVALTGEVPVRFVRLRVFSDGGSWTLPISALSEVSVFE
ncbi:hypothetical protein LXT21_29040 [Myxococcus sp. K38C18041901]|uniref:hypothetical protein n=1 Tax=Myxococcus guangdongensis TaxID=2906760 RepID=UPI0020A835D3|nr:hypothetical protein [Myxococcus guangdongensis]MCP3062838.1 hypothetical protein [Myxococcus guangdongensis]